MITEEENNLLTQTGKGTPCGELMRRYWQPAALSEELSADKPLPVQMFGEELILFRDGAGKPALIGRYCAHQGVDMIYGRVEEDGLRCMYHGWLFDNCGKVVLRGDWLPEKERRWDVGQPAYRCGESGGVIYTYMAPGDPPPLPDFSFLTRAAKDTVVARVSVDSNCLQAIDGVGDPTAVSKVESIEGGLRIYSLRKFNDTKQRVEIFSFLLPNLVVSTRPRTRGYLVNWRVAIDDRSHWRYWFNVNGKPARRAAQPVFFSAEANAAVRQLFLRTIGEMAEGREPKPAKAPVILALSDFIGPRVKSRTSGAKRRKAKS
jgi:nitrite reductase/ring-hydroxylating ferredoxin subunit